VLCGDISTYNLEGPPPPLRNIKYVMGKRARMEGFNTLDHWDSYAAGAAQLAAWVADGSIKHREHVFDGIDHAPEALVRLFTGNHLGKLAIKVD
jgi:NADPH-dependent curcumin reductase CurA